MTERQDKETSLALPTGQCCMCGKRFTLAWAIKQDQEVICEPCYEAIKESGWGEMKELD